MRAVNLLPRETLAGGKRRGGLDPAVAGGAALTVVVALAVAGGFVLAHSHARNEQRQLTTARAAVLQAQEQQATTPGVTTPQILSPPTALTQRQAWTDAVGTALVSRVPWDTMLAELARVVPANVTLQSLSLGGTATSPGSVTLTGSAYSQLGVAQLLSRLSLVPGLTQITLSSTSADATSGVVTFSVQADVAGIATAAPPTDTSTTATTTTGAAQ